LFQLGLRLLICLAVGACRYHCWNYRLLKTRDNAFARIDRGKNLISFHLVQNGVR
jgi:hypothetical protein